MTNVNKRFNGKCKRCGKAHTTFVVRLGLNSESFRMGPANRIFAAAFTSEETRVAYDNGTVFVPCDCGFHVALSAVRGKYRADKECNAKCLSGLGHTCECKCGGKNHGAGLCAH